MASFVRDYEQAAKGTEDETVWATKPDWEPLRVHENQGWRYIKKDRNGSAFHHIALKCRINYFCNLQLIKELLLCHWEFFNKETIIFPSMLWKCAFGGSGAAAKNIENERWDVLWRQRVRICLKSQGRWRHIKGTQEPTERASHGQKPEPPGQQNQ